MSETMVQEYLDSKVEQDVGLLNNRYNRVNKPLSKNIEELQKISQNQDKQNNSIRDYEKLLSTHLKKKYQHKPSGYLPEGKVILSMIPDDPFHQFSVINAYQIKSTTRWL